jgi:hypothetical protein
MASLRSGLFLLGVLATAGCGTTFEPASKVKTLRVLAVRKDKPFAKPGDTVHLSMLLTDGATDTTDGKDGSTGAPPKVQVLWLSGCENPAGDLYALCLPQLLSGTARTGTGFDFDLTLSPSIISGRKPPTDPKQPRYGLSYVFFAACAGEVRLDPGASGNDSPLACYSESGQRLGPESFVAGYTAVYAYDQFTNANPKVTGFLVDGQSVDPECVDDACVPLEAREFGALPSPSDAGVGSGKSRDAGPAALDSGLLDAGPVLADATVDGAANAAEGGTPRNAQPNPCETANSPLCVERCTSYAPCKQHEITLLVDPASDEPDAIAETRSPGTVYEQMWLNYYVDHGGSLGSGVKLLGDATSGFNVEHATRLTAPKDPGPFTVWAVAHDNRGGTSWVQVRMGAR